MILRLLFAITSALGASNIDGEPPACAMFKNLTKTREFIDKSLLISNILDTRKHIYIEAPPGFGKSTNLQMLRDFFAMQVDSMGYSINPAKILKIDATFREALRRCGGRRNTSTERGAFVMDTKDRSIDVNVTEALGISRNPLKNYDTFSKLPLKIYEQSPELFETQFARYPVLMVDLGALSTNSYQEFVRSFEIMVAKLFDQFRYLLKSSRLGQNNKDIFIRFRDRYKELGIEEVVRGGERLVQLLSAHHHRKSIVLVDNFDVPIRAALLAPHLNEQSFKGIKWSVSQFVKLLIKSSFVFRAVVTGNLRLEITDELIHFSIFEDPFLHRYFGFTEDDISELAIRFDDQKHITDIQNWYGNYITTPKGRKLYNTRSAISYFKTGDLKPHRNEALKFKTLKNLLDYEWAGRDVEDAFDNNTRILIRQKIPAKHLEDLKRTIVDSNQITVDTNLVLQILLDHGLYALVDENKLYVPNIEAMLDIKTLIFDRTYYINKLNITDYAIDTFVQSLEQLTSEDASYCNFSNAIKALFKYRVPRGARELAHTLLTLAADSRKFDLVRGPETPDCKRQDVLVKQRKDKGIIIRVTVDPLDYEEVKSVLLKSFQVFPDCKAKIGILLGLKRRGLLADLGMMYKFDNRTVVDNR
ncbi:unnamed protein product [Bemisia tabaci]|uniref:AAA-ATPase-like domain-containing protein n=1 Tax=Bemisia tabaci TaxID=7038 RepID=A0A9P0F350_BEMTA|nr:unnamed protein product [Bemisia tabaci]